MTTPGPRLLAGAADLAAAGADVAAAIERDHPDGLVLVGVLKGSLIFLADVARHLSVPTRIEMMELAPYDGTSRRTRVLKDVDRAVTGEAVVLVTGIVDTGLTADFLIRHLGAARPASIRVATLADKTGRRLVPVTSDYVAIHAPDEFLLGYGLDVKGRYRNLHDLWVGDGDRLRDDPDAYVDQFYGTTGN